MTWTHSSLNKHKEAVDKKALELKPDNESYKSNLQIAEDKVSSGVTPAGMVCSLENLKVSQASFSGSIKSLSMTPPNHPGHHLDQVDREIKSYMIRKKVTTPHNF